MKIASVTMSEGVSGQLIVQTDVDYADAFQRGGIDAVYALEDRVAAILTSTPEMLAVLKDVAPILEAYIRVGEVLNNTGKKSYPEICAENALARVNGILRKVHAV